MKLKDLGIAKKLGIGFGIVCLALLLLGGASIRGMVNIGSDMTRLGSYTLPVANEIADLENSTLAAIVAMQNFIMNGNADYLSEGRRQIALSHTHLDRLAELHRQYTQANSQANEKGRAAIHSFSESIDLSERQIQDNLRNEAVFDQSGQNTLETFVNLLHRYEALQTEAMEAMALGNEMKYLMAMMRLSLTASALFDSEDSFKEMDRHNSRMADIAKNLAEKESNPALKKELEGLIQISARYRETADAWLSAFRKNPAQARSGDLARLLRDQGNIITNHVETFLLHKTSDVERILRNNDFIESLTRQVAHMRILEKTYILDRNETNRDRWLAHYADISKKLEQAAESATDEESREILAQIRTNLQLYRQNASIWVNNRLVLENETLPELQRRGHVLAQLCNQASENAWQQFHIASENTLSIVKRATWGLSIVTLLGLAFAIAAGFTISKSISRPVQRLVKTAEALARGDMTSKSRISQKDEIGQLAHAVDTSMEQLATVVRDVKGNADTLAGASEELSTVSHQLASGSEEVTTQATNVAGATEQMSTNISTMASATEEMSVNIQGISSTAEQMSTNMKAVTLSMEESSAGIYKIAENAETNTAIAEKAMDLAGSATETMNLLGNAAKEIGDVTEVIKRIAEQTNLLALNATIEAASAGDAGRGFAVVASEIKALASQSAHAAENIAARIRGVQDTTGEAVRGIADVSGIIADITKRTNDTTEAVKNQTRIAETIASNIAEATAGIQHIATGIAEVAQGANDMSRNAGEAAQAARDIAANIQGVSAAAQQSSAAASQVNASAVDLSKLAGELRRHMEGFKTD
ncbi:methyl-accepting chemotaxis protein [Desulfobotulus mexicanus]|uniref:Methyl-accepting chemotaxis protein n=1 Tax=Desulfobotulus mexicanus TaxID=2586642 RepID=A0A5Q4VHH6_9BACT|nr:methyl-accepting chemotaxis protein [Desulfobotulus mexicanus]TYT75451.1 methyl-accepting chemotaxis protein [Desulfobotulus mexicanus]